MNKYVCYGFIYQDNEVQETGMVVIGAKTSKGAAAKMINHIFQHMGIMHQIEATRVMLEKDLILTHRFVAVLDDFDELANIAIKVSVDQPQPLEDE